MLVLTNVFSTTFRLASFLGFRKHDAPIVTRLRRASVAQHSDFGDNFANLHAAGQHGVKHLAATGVIASDHQHIIEHFSSMKQATSLTDSMGAEPWLVTSPLGHGLILLVALVVIAVSICIFSYLFGADDPENYRSDEECDEETAEHSVATAENYKGYGNGESRYEVSL